MVWTRFGYALFLILLLLLTLCLLAGALAFSVSLTQLQALPTLPDVSEPWVQPTSIACCCGYGLLCITVSGLGAAALNEWRI